MLLYFISALRKYSGVADAAVLEEGNLETNGAHWQQELLWPSPVACPGSSSRVHFSSAFCRGMERESGKQFCNC